MESKPKKIILIIEDEEPLSKALRDKLEGENFNVLIASNGENGLSMVKKNYPDLILLDLMLPKMPGEQVLKNIKDDENLKNIPVIVLSAKGDDASVKNCLEVLGANDYLSKSDSSLKEIISKINKLIYR